MPCSEKRTLEIKDMTDDDFGIPPLTAEDFGIPPFAPGELEALQLEADMDMQRIGDMLDIGHRGAIDKTRLSGL